MRKVKLGLFQDHIVEYGFEWDNMMIGQHNAIRRAEKDQYETRGLEYYLKDENGYITILNKVTLMEKITAILGYAFNINKKKVVAARDRCEKEEIISNENKIENNFSITNNKLEQITADKQELENLKEELLESLQENQKLENQDFEEVHEKSR